MSVAPLASLFPLLLFEARRSSNSKHSSPYLKHQTQFSLYEWASHVGIFKCKYLGRTPTGIRTVRGGVRDVFKLYPNSGPDPNAACFLSAGLELPQKLLLRFVNLVFHL